MTDKLISFISFFALFQIVCFIASVSFGACITFPMSIGYFAIAVIINYIFDFLRAVIGDNATNILTKILWVLIIATVFPTTGLTVISSLVMLSLIALVFVIF